MKASDAVEMILKDNSQHVPGRRRSLQSHGSGALGGPQAVLTPEEWVGFLKGNIIKYGMRQGRKEGADDDADKAKHYMKKLSEVEDGFAGF